MFCSVGIEKIPSSAHEFNFVFVYREAFHLIFYWFHMKFKMSFIMKTPVVITKL